MVTVITGATRSDNVLQAGLVIDMEAESHRLEEGTYIFETLSRRMGGGVENASRMEHKFRERRIMPSTVTVTQDAAAGATTVTVRSTAKSTIRTTRTVPRRDTLSTSRV